MANINSVSNPHKIACLTTSQCTADFLAQLKKTDKKSSSWLSLYPTASEMINHFFQLPQPLLILNTQFWHAAIAIVQTTNNSQLPLLALQNYDHEKLFGRINLLSQTQITFQQGEIANLKDGILILHISPLLVTPHLWFLLKAFLLNQQLSASSALNSEKLRGALPAQPSEKINTKIILVANRYQLDELAQIDPDYSQVSLLFSELSGEVKSSDENVQALRLYCQQLINAQSLQPLTDEAFAQLFLHLSLLCEHQKKILFSPKIIESILSYAQLFSQQSETQQGYIDKLHIQQALEIQHRAQSNAQNFSDQALLEKQLKIQLQGETIGQINGLSVVELMGYPTEFGEIFRISASDMVGDGEIIDVERKVELAGNVHAKSTLIVQGYLNHFFTHVANFPLSCNVVFEQSYQESDGDSASLAILLAVTSCYAQTAVAQNLFVTGALDQHGNVLAIGGINQKIESVARLFRLGLLTDAVTVLMPEANQINLMLSDETLKLIENKKINIFAIQHSLEAFPFAMSHSFETVIEMINKRIHFLHKEDDSEHTGIISKCLNLLR
ncbi:AAA family ATPase [Psychromonas hadalis]|uniref:AAA family ATPase n=1 Tax=Psychromonas hadalis TaxID=211669 RepID=UPI0003B4A5A1|nr:AAA family ATPase [Psychromonas hadalis]